MSNDVLINVEGVSKKFCRSLKKSLWYGLKDITNEALGRNGGHGQLYTEEFWALNNISFELRRGECLGLIGRNGAGKTTLLRMLNGLIKPDKGRIEMRGRVGALIALGAGFNPILTGRENIYINGSVLGLNKRKIDEKIEEIVNFAEIGEFIDSPVQSYSSGMKVRLGFAVAVALQPDIFLIDEVLAVGDTAFKVRCYNRIRDLLPGAAVIFVSHSMQEIARICSRALVLKSGNTYFSGSKTEGIYAYEKLNRENEIYQGSDFIVHKSELISDVHVIGYETSTSRLESCIEAGVHIWSNANIGRVRIRLVLHDDSSGTLPIAEWDSEVTNELYELNAGKNLLSIKVERIRLRTGHYRVVLVVADPKAQGYYVNIEYGLHLEICNEILSGAHYRI
jgi:lipopolysaccharide transport system ATP-binding protein